MHIRTRDTIIGIFQAIDSCDIYPTRLSEIAKGVLFLLGVQHNLVIQEIRLSFIPNGLSVALVRLEDCRLLVEIQSECTENTDEVVVSEPGTSHSELWTDGHSHISGELSRHVVVFSVVEHLL